MNTQYEPYWHQAVELRSKTNSFVGASDHPVARSLRQDTSMLVEDIQLGRKQDVIGGRIDDIQSRLRQARTMGDEIIKMPDNRYLRSNFERIRDGISQSPPRRNML